MAAEHPWYYWIVLYRPIEGAQWLSGRVLDSRQIEPHLRHCVVVLGQDKFILA